jgi:hypothetical protein
VGQTTDRIEHHIDETREELGNHIHELQDKARLAMDRARNAVGWRYQTRERPWAMLGVAFGVGLAAAVASAKAWRGVPSPSSQRFAGQRSDSRRAAEIWDNLRYAVAAAILAKVEGVTRDVLPGFWKCYERRSEPEPASRRSSRPCEPNITGAAI